MIHVDFDPELLPPDRRSEWEAWEAKADAATQLVIAAWENWKKTAPTGASFKHTFEESIWGEWKNWLLANIFFNKCAYCETPLVRDQFHAEHFRPKGRVTFRVLGGKSLEKANCQDLNGQAAPHPGYFWLAYHWLNLLPSCARCNSGRGKKDQFPVACSSHVLLLQMNHDQVQALSRKPLASKTWEGFYYLDPLDLDSLEGRLLLHPYLDEPAQDLVFGELGIVAARDSSLRGEHSLRVYDLEADELSRARQAAQDQVRTLYFAAKAAQPRGTSIAMLNSNARQTVSSLLDSRAPYSAAVRDYLQLLS